MCSLSEYKINIWKIKYRFFMIFLELVIMLFKYIEFWFIKLESVCEMVEFYGGKCYLI